MGKPSRIGRTLRSKLENPSVRGEIVVAMIGLTILPLLLASLYFFPHINRFVEDRLTSYGEELISQVESSMNNAIAQTESISDQMTYWTITRNLLTPSVDRPPSRVRAVQDTQQFISNLKLSVPLVSGVYVVGENKQIFTSNYSSFNESLAEKPWVSKALTDGIGSWVIPPHIVDYEERLPGAPCDRVFSYVRGITAYYLGHSHKGVIQVDLRVRDVLAFIENVDLGPGAVVQLVSKQGRVVSGDCNKGEPDAESRQLEGFEILPLGTSRSSGTITIKRDLANTGWFLTAQVPVSGLAGDLRQTTRTFGAVMALIAVAAIAIASIVARRITRPLALLVASINRFGEGHLQERVPDFSNRDLGTVSKRFNKMADRISRLLQEVIEEEKQKDRAEIRALQAQVNPHFLYNTLEAIRGISLAHGVLEAGEIAKALSSIFRYSINREQESVTVSDEMGNISNYVTILDHRYGERFTFELNVAEDVQQTPIVRLALQPLVENAFFHGLDKQTRHGRVEVIGKKEDKFTIIEVRDNGVGMSPTKLRAIKAGLRSFRTRENEPSYGLGVGLVSVSRRIQFAYGTPYGIEIESEQSRGTIVRVRLPHNGATS
jgi:two-component system, sensor histidine kinase YesM